MKQVVAFILFILVGCVESRVKRYGDLLDPQIGTASKAEISKQLGAPTFCRPDANYELCEYRTATGRNEQVPVVHKKSGGFSGPDLSPYEHYDVIHVFYDSFGMARDWKAIVLPESP